VPDINFPTAAVKNLSNLLREMAIFPGNSRIFRPLAHNAFPGAKVWIEKKRVIPAKAGQLMKLSFSAQTRAGWVLPRFNRGIIAGMTLWGRRCIPVETRSNAGTRA
jgi:hypothetical protein